MYVKKHARESLGSNSKFGPQAESPQLEMRGSSCVRPTCIRCIQASVSKQVLGNSADKCNTTLFTLSFALTQSSRHLIVGFLISYFPLTVKVQLIPKVVHHFRPETRIAISVNVINLSSANSAFVRHSGFVDQRTERRNLLPGCNQRHVHTDVSHLRCASFLRCAACAVA